MEDLAALTQAVITQRLDRLNDTGPALRGVGAARFHISGGALLVGDAQPRPGKLDELVHRVVQFARDRWLVASWTLVRGRDDPGLAQALLGHGFTLKEELRLMGRIGPVVPVWRTTAGVTVAPVATLDEMMTYERISSWGFNHIESPTAEHVRMRGRERWDEQQAQWYHYYLGRLNGAPVSGAYVSLWEVAPTIYGVVTIPPARGHGVAGQVMQRLVADTLARGFRWTCLYVALGNPAERLYRSLGFAPLLEQTTYEWRDSFW